MRPASSVGRDPDANREAGRDAAVVAGWRGAQTPDPEPHTPPPGIQRPYLPTLPSMPGESPSPQYHALREQIEGILSEGKIHTRQAGEWGRVETYWHIGDALQTHFRGHPRAEYGHQVVRNLSKDIGLSESLVWDILLFRRALPILPTYGESGWSHIREVLPAPTQDQRLYYLRAAEEGAWSVRQLRQAVRADAYGRHTDQPWAVPADQDPHQGRPLRARFGELHTSEKQGFMCCPRNPVSVPGWAAFNPTFTRVPF